MRVVAPYVQILSTPGAKGMAAAGVLGRLPVAIIGPSIVIMVAARYGSYGLAGSISATQTLCYGIFGPPLSRLADRYGQHRVLEVASLITTVGLLGLAGCGYLRFPAKILFVCAVLVGVMPNVGSMVRARWTHLLRRSGRQHTAYAMESVVDDLIFIVGPVLAVSVCLTVNVAAGLVAAAVLLFAGCRLLAIQRSTQPPATTVAKGCHDAPTDTWGMATVVAVCTVMGCVFGSVEVASIAFTTDRHEAAQASVVLALYALGSGISGVLFGRHRLRWSVSAQLKAAAVVLLLTSAPILVVGNVWALGLILLVSGTACAPILILATGLVETYVPAQRLTEGMTWISTGLGLGVALGSPVAGWAADVYGADRGFVVPLLCCVAMVLITAVGVRAPVTAPSRAHGR